MFRRDHFQWSVPPLAGRHRERTESGRAGKHVAVLIETSTSWGKGIVQGIGDYARENGPWYFYMEPRGQYEQLQLAPEWRGDGVLARVTSQKLLDQILKLKIPAIDVSWHPFSTGILPRCSSNESEIAQLAFQHLRERGFKRFAYCGPWYGSDFVDEMGDTFIRDVENFGCDCYVYRTRRSMPNSARWLSDLEDLSKWLLKLPKPIGMMAYNDVRGRRVTEACRYAGIRVPEEIAVICGGYDELMGTMSNPPLTTVDAVPRQVGYEAAKLLDCLMKGQKISQTRVLISPKRVIVRQSTNVLAIEDPDLAASLRYIQEHSDQNITVSDVLKQVPISRRRLEQKFIKLLGRSPAEEIRRVRIDRVKALLEETDWSVAKIALACDFSEPEALTRIFTRTTGIPPSQYRGQFR